VGTALAGASFVAHAIDPPAGGHADVGQGARRQPGQRPFRHACAAGSRLKDDPLTVQAGFRYKLYWATGTVTGYKTWTDTVSGRDTYSDQHGNTRTQYWSHTYVRESFTLMRPRSEHKVFVTNSSVEIPNGHLATGVWASRKGASSGEYVLFFDRTAGEVRRMIYGLGPMLRVKLRVLRERGRPAHSRSHRKKEPGDSGLVSQGSDQAKTSTIKAASARR
jgi:hypothetical protein